jgi:hypothetical protein
MIKTFAIINRRTKTLDGTPGTRRDSFDFPILAFVHAGQLEFRDRHGHRVRTEHGESVMIELSTCVRSLPWQADPGVAPGTKRSAIDFPIQMQFLPKKKAIEIRTKQGGRTTIARGEKVELMPTGAILTEEKTA